MLNLKRKKKMYDIMPAGLQEVVDLREKSKKNKSLVLVSLRKIAILLLIVGLNWAGISAVGHTLGYFSDIEQSLGNKLEAGTLDFELFSPSDFLPSEISIGQFATKTISILNDNNLFKYIISAEEFSDPLCDQLDLEADINGGDLEYSGKLINFSLDANAPVFYSDPEDWNFKITAPADLPGFFQGKNCQFKFVFSGSQVKNDLPFPKGYNDMEEIENNISIKEACRCGYTNTIGYWKNHPEIYMEYLTFELGCRTEIFIEGADNIFEKAKAKDMANMLKAQLLAMKFNVLHFDIGDYQYLPGKTLADLVAEADALLCQNPEPSRSVLEKMKDLLDCLNNSHCFHYCPDGLVDELDILQEGQSICPSATICTEEVVKETRGFEPELIIENDEDENMQEEEELIILPDIKVPSIEIVLEPEVNILNDDIAEEETPKEEEIEDNDDEDKKPEEEIIEKITEDELDLSPEPELESTEGPDEENSV